MIEVEFIIFLGVMFASVVESWAGNDNFTFTYSMASRCKEHICRRGYVYDTFYQIDEANLRHAIVKVDNTEVSYFEMHIAIQAPSNGHILLSSTERPALKDPVYEIVVGGGGNKFTELRLNQKKNARGSAQTPGILSAIEFTAFYIRISDDGLVEFGKEGDSDPLLHYFDARTTPIKYFSFASWTGVEAKFLYDCPDPNSDDAKTPDSQVVAPKLSKSDELKRSLLMSRLPSIPPSPSVPVHLGIRVTHVMYDAMESKLTSRLAVVMGWVDNNMAWNPTKYNGTTSIKFRQGQIWRPKFFAFNSDGTDPLDTKNPDLITVLHSGESTFHFQTEVTTWCTNTVDGYNKWPHDEYSCAIVIEPWEVHEKITIERMDPSNTKMEVFADIDEVIQSEWEISYHQVVAEPHFWNRLFNTDNLTHQSDRFIINLEMSRNATSYNIVFYTPLLVLLTFILMSFWSEPLQMSRVWFYTGCAIVICIALANINFMVPTHTVPSIMILYITILCGVLLALLIQVILMTTTAEKMCRTGTMQNILTSSILRTVFCLPPIKVSLNGEYSPQEDDGEVFTNQGSIEEMESDDHTCGDRVELAEMLDKTMFFLYSIVAASMLAAHY